MELPTTTPEQRAEIYTDIRKLIYPGFIAHPVVIDGTGVVLRSLNERDWALLEYRAAHASIVNWKRWCVAVSIWMVDGQIVLGDEGALHRIRRMVSSLTTSLLEDLYAILNALTRRVREATDRVEAFLYEDESRYMWRSEGFQTGDDFSLRGRVGLNPIQKLWIFFNQLEDESHRERMDWELAKFVAGPHAPKGIKKINAKDKQARSETERSRQRMRDRVYYEAKGMIPKRKDEEARKKRAQRFGDWNVQMAESEEELQDEMRRWVAGVKDDHDLVVDGVKAKIKHEVEDRRKRAKAQREALARAMEEEGITKSQLVPLTGKAANEFIERVKARVPGVSKVVQDATHNSAYEKYIKNNPEVGSLRVDEDGNITSEEPVSPEMLEVLRKPEGEKRSLQEQIESRRPTLESLSGRGEEDS